MAEAPADHTQTVVTGQGSATHSSVTSSSLPHESLEGRFTPGTLLNGRYRIIALLGKGGMGEVYRATDLTLGQSVALKFLPALSGGDPRWLERFHNEVRIARQVSHPNVCRVYDIGQAEGLTYLSMEYVDGEDLSTLLRRIGRLPSEKATEIARKICAGLGAAHDQGVIHRDLKPHNVMLNKRGEVLICDFGLAALPDQILPSEFKQGTPAYMAPEQIKGTGVTAQSDIFALGLVLYELYTGKRPYNGANLQELLAQHEAMAMTSMSTHAADIEPAVENIIKRCLDPDPLRRPAQALQVSMALPGGDPLAAALAAGQTPSPEMVASSKSEGLRLRYSLPLLGLILLAILAFPILKGNVDALQYTPADLPPSALTVEARRIAARFGYEQKPTDYAWWMIDNGSVVKYVREKTKHRNWYEAFRDETPLRFAYRESLITTLPRGPFGQVSWELPAFEDPLMLRLQLDTRGRLRYFEGMAPRDPQGKAGPGVSREAIEQATGYRLHADKATAPFRTPLAAYDEIHAYQATSTGLLQLPVRIQYASHRGYLTSLHIWYPWSQLSPTQARSRTLGQMIQQGVVAASFLLFLFYCLSLAWRNWKSGRADRKGALEIAIVLLVLQLIGHLAGLHVTFEVEQIYFFLNAFGEILTTSVLMFFLYLALEPALRSRWPQSIVTWSRLLKGRLLDPQVGAHMLIGAGLGVLLSMFFLGQLWFEFWSLGELANAGSNMLGGPSNWVRRTAEMVDNAIRAGMVIFFAIFGLKVLLKRDWLVILVGSLLLPLQEGGLTQSTQIWIDLPIYVSVYAIIMIGMIRFGLLSAVVGFVFVNGLGRMTTNNDFTAWYMPGTVASMLMLGGMAIFFFWRSLGDQKLVGGVE